MKSSSIIFLEDDGDQADIFNQQLEFYCSETGTPLPKITVISSETAFLKSLEAASAPADLYILDLMVCWDDGDAETSEIPVDYHEDWAGIRCKDAVLARFPNAKIIIWTVIETDHIPEENFTRCRSLQDKLKIKQIFRILNG